MKILAYLGGVLLWLPQTATALTGAEVMAKAREQFAAYSTFSARFEKQFYWTALDKTQKLQGRIYTRKPDRFRVEVEGGDLVVADGQAIWVYSKKNQQVVVSEYNGEVRTPWQVLLDYTAQWTPAGVEETRLDGRACYLLDLRPPSGGGGQLKVWLERRRWLLLKVEERDESDNLGTYVLRDHQLGPTLKPNLFRFVAPEGVEVIDRRGDGQR
ncbi:MAG: outer membrane lipoprotein carrier protein LolA [Candidatus Latescibacteria bacterium]|nr:outer membrane lipoprotein carrier protein LolA [Candidatus Latescibacterota bacterium]